MKKRFLLCSFAMAAALVLAATTAGAAEWRFPVGPTYVSGFSDVQDLFEDNLRYRGYVVESSAGVPVGLSFHPYYQWDSGLGMGVGFGPAMVIAADSSTESYSLTIVPLSFDVRYAFNITGSVSPYVRGGATYLVASGDFKDSVQPGLFAALGLEFLRQKKISVGFEVGYDSAVVKMERLRDSAVESIKPIGFNAGIYVIF